MGDPAVRAFSAPLAAHRTVVRCDKPGCGLSDPWPVRQTLAAETEQGMNRRGVIYDVGTVFSGFGWRINLRPTLDPRIVHRELQILSEDLHCNAVRIAGRDIDRVSTVAEDALRQGLEVWFSPALFEKSQRRTLGYLVKAAAAAETLRRRWPDRLVFVMGSELTLFMQGIVPGRSIAKRLANPALAELVRAGGHNQALNAFLASASAAVRGVFHGPLTYASLPSEEVDWSLFDVVGVDHYRDARIKDRYAEMLRPLLAHGKPVVVTEFGMRTYRGAEGSGALGFGVVDQRTVFLHQLPLVGRFARPRLKGVYVRDEGLQARELTETLSILDAAGVDGAFVSSFVDPIATFSENPGHDLDMSALSLVKSYANGHGTTFPDMSWEPKEAFRAVADYYARHG